ncbi:MAG TPA: hypothetical protein VK021_12000 [Flavobacteriaceae bacterium]|nr:hypothetical protein [Flavobacteriaceae bacterium]
MKWTPIFFFFLSLVGFSQEIETALISQTPFSHERFLGIDKYESQYSIDKNTLYKKTPEKTYQFSALQLGELTSVDILNPLKIVLFYRDLNTAILLDDKLSEIERVRFNELSEFKTPAFVTKATRSNLWVFNINTQTLEIFDYKQKKVIAQSQSIPQPVIDQQSNFNYCWLLTADKLKRYNIYGSFVEEFLVEDITDISFYNNYILLLNVEGELQILDYKAKEFQTLSLPEIKIRDIYTADKNIYIYDGETLYHYTFNFSK